MGGASMMDRETEDLEAAADRQLDRILPRAVEALASRSGVPAGDILRALERGEEAVCDAIAALLPEKADVAALTAFQALEKHRVQVDERQRRAWRLQRLLRPGRRA